MGASNPAHFWWYFCLIFAGLVWCLVLPSLCTRLIFCHVTFSRFCFPCPCKDIPGAPLVTHQNSIKFILQNIFCNQEVISNWLSVQARAARVEYQEDPSIIGRPACSWPGPTSSFTLGSRFRPDKRFRAAAPCGDPSQDTIYYPPLPSSPLLGIRSNFIGPFGDAGKQSQTNAVGFARSFTTFKHNIFLGDQIR